MELQSASRSPARHDTLVMRGRGVGELQVGREGGREGGPKRDIDLREAICITHAYLPSLPLSPSLPPPQGSRRGNQIVHIKIEVP